MTTRAHPSAIDSFIRSAGDRLDGSPLAVMLDVDGTLAPIAPTPDAARIPEETRAILRELAALRGTAVVLVSGRSAANTWSLAGIERAWIIGNHGFELRSPDGDTQVADAVTPYAGVVARAADLLTETAATIPGALVENKRWTISVHYRLVTPGDMPRLHDRARVVASELGLDLRDGKKTAELRPPVRIDKGTACVELASRLGALDRSGSVLYAGDDQTDEDAFRALRARGPRALTVHIMASASESLVPPSVAEVTLASPAELREALEWLVARRGAR